MIIRSQDGDYIIAFEQILFVQLTEHSIGDNQFSIQAHFPTTAMRVILGEYKTQAQATEALGRYWVAILAKRDFWFS